MTAHKNPQLSLGQDRTEADLRDLEKARAIFKSLSKFIGAKKLYADNNPILTNFAKAFDEAFRAFFEDEDELLLTIEQYRITWRDQTVYENQDRGASVAFLFYKDGVGEITFRAPLMSAELTQFADLIKEAIYHPPPDLDIITKLWSSDFANISYRVLDEHLDGEFGEDQGTSGDSQKQSLQANDHKNLPGMADEGSNSAASGDPTESIGTYLQQVVDQEFPNADEQHREEQIQNMLASFFTVTGEELKSYQEEFAQYKKRDKLVWVLNVILDFVPVQNKPSVVRNALDTIERLMGYIKEEANVQTLIEVLETLKKRVSSHAVSEAAESLLDHFEKELTDSSFLLALGKTVSRLNNDAREVLRYYRLVGSKAAPALCKLFEDLNGPSLHKEACDALIAIAPDDITRLIDNLNVNNPHVAQDAVYLLRRSTTNEVPPLIKELMFCPYCDVREEVIGYLADVGNEEAASLLASLLDDDDKNVRVKTLTAVEEIKDPAIIDKVISLCFREEIAEKSMDELAHMFRTVGKLAGEKVLVPVKQLMEKQSWYKFGRDRNKRNKLLAITALRHVPCGETLGILRELAEDDDSLVRAKAQFVLRTLGDVAEPDSAGRTPVRREEAGE